MTNGRRRRKGGILLNLPGHVSLLTQRIRVETAENLHHVPEGQWVHAEGEEPHGHRAYGVYDEGAQVITLDDSLGFERARETFLHENLHAVLSISKIEALIEGQAEGLSEHIVSAMAPILLAWMRENPATMAYLTEVQNA